jgi:molybdopterin converting factor small subunit
MAVIVEIAGFRPASTPQRTAVEGVETAGQAIERLAVSDRPGLIILVNGRLASWHTRLQDNDIVQLIPAPAGG